jgi:hypothetical protein
LIHTFNSRVLSPLPQEAESVVEWEE